MHHIVKANSLWKANRYSSTYLQRLGVTGSHINFVVDPQDPPAGFLRTLAAAPQRRASCKREEDARAEPATTKICHPSNSSFVRWHI